MSRRVAQNVSLIPEPAAFIATRVAPGHDADVGAVVHAALALLTARQPRRNTHRERGDARVAQDV